MVTASILDKITPTTTWWLIRSKEDNTQKKLVCKALWIYRNNDIPRITFLCLVVKNGRTLVNITFTDDTYAKETYEFTSNTSYKLNNDTQIINTLTDFKCISTSEK